MQFKARYVSDIIIGILTATSTIWVDVNLGHRIIIAIMVAFAAETLLRWIEDRQQEQEMEEKIIDFDEALERKQRNREKIYAGWQKEMP